MKYQGIIGLLILLFPMGSAATSGAKLQLVCSALSGAPPALRDSAANGEKGAGKIKDLTLTVDGKAYPLLKTRDFYASDLKGGSVSLSASGELPNDAALLKEIQERGLTLLLNLQGKGSFAFFSKEEWGDRAKQAIKLPIPADALTIAPSGKKATVTISYTLAAEHAAELGKFRDFIREVNSRFGSPEIIAAEVLVFIDTSKNKQFDVGEKVVFALQRRAPIKADRPR